MKKRILLVNKFYYPRGGDCVVTLNLEKLLIENGFEVMVYAMNYHDNIQSKDGRYFASEVDFAGGISQKIKAAKRIFGYGDIKASFNKALHDFKPDIVHLQNIHSYISPIVAKLAKDAGCKVVWTLHDYKLLCPSYSCLNNGKPCELCFSDKTAILKHKCMKGSTIASVLAYLEAKKWNKRWLEKYVDAFVCPSEFMKAKMIQGGFNPKKLHTICNFIDPVKAKILDACKCDKKEDYYVYIGRLSQEKGAETLLEVASKLTFPIKIAGGGPLLEELKVKYSNYDNISFLGHCNATEISNLISKALFSVVPSECYENNPLSLIESLCAGTPVIGATIGGIPELINDYNGTLFKSRDKKELELNIIEMYSKKFNYYEIKEKANIEFSGATALKKFINLYYYIQ